MTEKSGTIALHICFYAIYLPSFVFFLLSAIELLNYRHEHHFKARSTFVPAVAVNFMVLFLIVFISFFGFYAFYKNRPKLILRVRVFKVHL